jgi:integrase
MDDILQDDGSVKRTLVCKKLSVPYSGHYKTKKDVRKFVQEIIEPINDGAVNVHSTMSLANFVEKVHLPKLEQRGRRSSTMKGYRDVWRIHLKSRIGGMTLREFRTVHGEQVLADIAKEYVHEKTKLPLTHNSLARMKSFLSGVFKQAKRLGILDGVNPIMDVSTPEGAGAHDTYAYSLEEVMGISYVLDEPGNTVVLTAALSGLRKGEIRGLKWEDFTGAELTVRRSVVDSQVNEPKTKSSRASVPVVQMLAEALEAHRKRMGKLAAGYIFQAGNGSPLDLDNLVNRAIKPALEKCVVCKMSKYDHSDGHEFKRDNSLPVWHGWHAFRRGLATNLHRLGVEDREIQAILRHSDIRTTQAIYIKSVPAAQVSAMDLIGAALKEKLTCSATCNAERRPVN